MTWANTSKDTTTFTNTQKTNAGVFGTYTIDQLASQTFNGNFRGKLLEDYTFNDIITGITWANNSKL